MVGVNIDVINILTAGQLEQADVVIHRIFSSNILIKYSHQIFSQIFSSNILTAGELEQADVVIHRIVGELHSLAHDCYVAPGEKEISILKI